jgi:CDP-paratose 2-epimerase
MKRILITGGAGFVGSFLARRFKRDEPGLEVVALDNLRRRGSELNVPLLEAEGVGFRHGDVRVAADLEELGGAFDLVIEASAEPSVLGGLPGGRASPRYVLDSNLAGAVNCFELARRTGAGVIFLSTSRVYSVEPLRAIPLREGRTRFEAPGFGGVSETFATHLPRSLYGATKLAAEQVLQEYVAAYGVRAVIDRCGVIAGPGQFGRTDQGVFTHWVAAHHYGTPLRYTGFGGKGKQVRDLLHPEDLYALVAKQARNLDRHAGEVFNVGGGADGAVSLLELTELCREATGKKVPVARQAESAAVDVPYFVTDASKARRAFGWAPTLGPRRIVEDVAEWLKREGDRLEPVLKAA